MLENKINTRHSRFRDAPFFSKLVKKSVAVCGIGGIGSALVPMLSRIVSSIYIYDYDIVEKVNLASQTFTIHQLGKFKVNAITEIAMDLGTAKIYPYNEKVDKETDIPETVIFSCFDNMQARKDLFEIWKKKEDRELLIEARLLLDQYEVFFVQKGQEEAYEATLFEDSEIPEVGCTIKQTNHWAHICAGRMVHGLTNFYSKHMFYSLPFHIREEGNLFLIEIKK